MAPAPLVPCSCGCGGAGPKALPLAQAALDLEQSERTLRRWVQAGCPHHKGPGRTGALTFDRLEVEAWMRQLGRTGEMGRPPAEVTLLAGGPQSGQPRPMAGDIAAVVAARQAPAKADGEDLRALGALVNVQIKQLEVRKRERQEREAEGELVPLADVQRWWTSQIQALTTALEALPGRIATEAAGRPYEEVYSAAEREVAVMRERLAVEALRG